MYNIVLYEKFLNFATPTRRVWPFIYNLQIMYKLVEAELTLQFPSSYRLASRLVQRTWRLSFRQEIEWLLSEQMRVSWRY